MIEARLLIELTVINLSREDVAVCFQYLGSGVETLGKLIEGGDGDSVKLFLVLLGH